MLSIQKKDAKRTPCVTGSTRCRLLPGWRIARRQFDPVRAVGVADDEFAALVFFRGAQEQGGGQVGADPMRGAGYRPDRPVDMVAISLAILIPVEQRRQDLQRQRRRQNQRAALERSQDQPSEAACGRMELRELPIALDQFETMARGDPSVDPLRRRQRFAAFGNLFHTQDTRNSRQQPSLPNN
jgi:hypothetical protein